MKKLLLIIPLLLFTAKVDAQNVIAEDHASNYSDTQFEALENLGTGFGDWYRVVDGDDAAVLIQPAADNGSNSAVIDTEGQSFGLRASLTDQTDQRVDLGREFGATLEDGNVLSFNLAWNWTNPGLTGFTLHNGSWEAADQVMVLDFDQEGYFVNGEFAEDPASAEDWDEGDQWRQEGVALEVTITRNGDNLEYSMVAITAQSHVDFSGVVESANADRIRFFNDGRPNWGEGNPGQGSLFVNSLMISEGEATSIDGTELAHGFRLEQNYPNPFNPTTNITFTLSEAQHISLSVYDMLGRQVRVLENGVMAAGEHNIHFDASNLNSGVYFYRLSTQQGTVTRNMTLLK